jgi:hypothetical protein
MGFSLGRAIAAAIVLSSSISGEALACACCSEPGQRFDRSEVPDAYIRGELALLKFGNTAKGSREGTPVAQVYRLKASRIKREVALTLTDAMGGTGRIVIPLPKMMSRQEYDAGKGDAKSAGGGPDITKEWRFEGPAKLSGIVARGGTHGSATLILRGHGNSCAAAPDFTHWTLAVAGRASKLEMVGTFAEPADAAGRAMKQ